MQLLAEQIDHEEVWQGLLIKFLCLLQPENDVEVCVLKLIFTLM